MLTEKFHETIQQEGVVTIVTVGEQGPHLVNTWNSYIVVTEDGRLLIPAYAMRRTEKNILANGVLKFSLGSRDVIGYNNYQGTGFVGEGTGRFISEGEEYNHMKEKFSFLTRVLEINVTKCKQML